MHQHTGNWAGKTVSNAKGEYEYNKNTYEIIDLPGTYSLMSNSEEEEIAKNYICSKPNDCIVVVVDATRLERSLNLAKQIMQIENKVIVCVNLLDEATKKGISIDLEQLTKKLGVPVVGVIARKKKTLKNLCQIIEDVCNGKIKIEPKSTEHEENVEKEIEKMQKEIEKICSKVVHLRKSNYNESDRKIDKILTSKLYGIPIMIIFLGIIFWLTITGANYPSELLSDFFTRNRKQTNGILYIF